MSGFAKAGASGSELLDWRRHLSSRAAWQTAPLAPARGLCRLPSARPRRGGTLVRAAASFRTEVHAPRLPVDIQLADRLFFMGSCFSENIGGRLASLKFQVRMCLRARQRRAPEYPRAMTLALLGPATRAPR